MKNHHGSYESQLWKLLEKEGLADLSQFHRADCFDEVPLYSRRSDVAFLSKLDKNAATGVLLQFSLKFLRAVVSYEEHRQPYFAAITAWSGPEDDPIVLNLFVWSGPLAQVYDQLRLGAVQTPFAKHVKRLVTKLGIDDRLDVLEDSLTTAEMSRVFVGFTIPPYQSFAPLYLFRKMLSPASQ
jgi:hypothetical protein